ncbi:MAG: LysM peptidoglycan-binding domain-containing protein, partial [Deltaproteobacteria bacterium]|nr:LysM peptidoglycan-binding domain-containing protein [Deltaproteobacteria bacterium]
SNPPNPAPPKKVTQVEKPPEYHVVQKGETFYSISKQYDLTVADLLQYNNLTLKDIIRPDQKLQISFAPSNTQSN